MNTSTHRQPYVGNSKSMARLLQGEGQSASITSATPRTHHHEPASTQARLPDEQILVRLGLASLRSAPLDPRLLIEKLKADDAADSQIDLDEFSRGIRRAVRLRIAYSTKVYRQAGHTWPEWIESNFTAGYSCFQRYSVAADLQLELLSRGLPALVNERQSRAIAPFRRHTRFWEALGSECFKNGFPSSAELRQLLEKLLGLKSTAAALTPRVQLHRSLDRIARSIPKGNEDPVVFEALSLIARAIAMLQGGGGIK